MRRKPDIRELSADERIELDALIADQRADDRARMSHHFGKCISLELVLSGAEEDGLTLRDMMVTPEDYSPFGELERLMTQHDLCGRHPRKRRQHGWRFTRRENGANTKRKEK